LASFDFDDDVSWIRGEIMRKVSQLLLAGAVLSAFVAPAGATIATSDGAKNSNSSSEPVILLAQAPAPPPDPKQQKKPGPPAAPARPAPPAHPAAPPPQPPHAPVQAAPPPPPRAPAQAPQVAPPQRPVQGPPVQQQNAPARQQFQRPAQTAPTQPTPVPGQPPRQQIAPAQGPAPVQRPAQTAPTQPTPVPDQPLHQQQQLAPAQGQPVAPLQRPAQTAPTQVPGQQPTPGQGPGTERFQRPAQGVPGQGPAGVPNQRPAQSAPLPSALPAPAAGAIQPIRPAGPGPASIAPQTAQGQPMHRMDQMRTERHETQEGGRTVIREPDRVIVRENDGRFMIRHDEGERFRFNARDVRQERRGNDNVTTVVRADGARIVTVVDPNGRLLRRSRFMPDGREVIIIDDSGPVRADGGYFVELAPPMVRIPRERYIVETERASPELIYDTLMAPPIEALERPYSLEEIRYSPSLRDRMPRIDIDTINFEFGSWEVAPDQVDLLGVIADAINRVIARNPREVFLIEGHTDAVGSDVDNLSLSDRRAETVALVLSDRFQVPPENLTTQGYGKQYLKIPTDAPERQNRRVTVRRITPLLAGGN
jgi:outer membrane protein OmpA-like peptidoglycan-associated protein